MHPHVWLVGGVTRTAAGKSLSRQGAGVSVQQSPQSLCSVVCQAVRRLCSHPVLYLPASVIQQVPALCLDDHYPSM